MYVSSQDQKLTHNKLKNMTQAWTRKPCKAFKKALDVFLPVFLSKIIFVTTSHSSGVMVNKTFPIMDEVIHVWAMPEFLNQDCYGGAHKHSLIFKPSLSQLSCLLFNVHIWSEKLKKKNVQRKEWNGWNIFSLQLSAFWCDHLNEGVNKLTRRKPFLW